MVEVNYNESEGIVYVKMNGKFGVHDMLASAENVGQLSHLTKNLKILEDAKNVIIDFQVSDIPLLMKNFGKNIEVYDSVRHAVIHSGPEGTAYTMLAAHLNELKKYSIMVFSTEEAAKTWLNLI
ncbi:MAG: hypothetical protein WCI48_03330 [Bacteroidota bacterium]|jgi:hypothetical protein